MIKGGFRLGIDFGTSSSVAVLAGPNGPAKPLLFDASPLLSSGVFAGPADTSLLTGADAENAARAYPAGYEANPKRHVDEGSLWLGERAFAVTDAIAAVLSRIGAEARRVAGESPATVVLTHPATWSRTRLGILADAAARAQLGDCRFVAEPVAAAAYFANVLNRSLPTGRCLVVYDLGAGTCDVSIVRGTASGPEVLASAGLDDVGGLDLDATVVGHAQSVTTAATSAWGRLDWPQTPADHRNRRLLWRDARAAKEQLSRHAIAELHIPLVDTDIHLTRDEFERLARPHLDRTIELATTVLRTAGITRTEVADVFLVGGSSRVPLVASLLHRSLRIAPTALDHPELVVAEGSLHAIPATRNAPEPPPPVAAPAGPEPQVEAPTPDDSARQTAGPPQVAIAPRKVATKDSPADRTLAPGSRWPPRTSRDRAVIGGVIALVLVIVAAARLWPPLGSNKPDESPSGGGPSNVATLTGHTQTIYDVTFSPDGKTLATASSDDTVRLWDVATGETVATLTGHTKTVGEVAFSPDGRTLASASQDTTVRLWNVATGRATATVRADAEEFTGVAFSPDRRTLATNSTDETVRLRNAATGDVTATLAVELGDDNYYQAKSNGVAFSPDGRTLATASSRVARLWDVATGKNVAALTAPDRKRVEELTFSPDGTTLATCADEAVRLWDVATGNLLRTLAITDPHDNRNGVKFHGVAFSPDGKSVTTTSTDKAVRLWDVASGKTTATVADDTVALDVAFSPDGTTLATASGDAVRLWKIDS